MVNRYIMGTLLIMVVFLLLVVMEPTSGSKYRPKQSSIFYIGRDKYVGKNLISSASSASKSLLAKGSQLSKMYQLPLRFVSNAKPVDIVTGKSSPLSPYYLSLPYYTCPAINILANEKSFSCTLVGQIRGSKDICPS